jgi:hypothetical protein
MSIDSDEPTEEIEVAFGYLWWESGRSADLFNVITIDFVLYWETTFKFFSLNVLVEKGLNEPSRGHPFNEIIMLDKHTTLRRMEKEGIISDVKCIWRCIGHSILLFYSTILELKSS